MRKSFVYILCNKNRTVLYIGVTNNLQRRMNEHKASKGSLFTDKYNTTDLLYFEEFVSIITQLKEKNN